jgi:hypothetical protein
MAGSRPPLPTRDEEIDFHRRLVEGDPVASSELVSAYLLTLIAHLTKTNSRRVPPDFIEQAAGEALISLIKNPISFDPSKSDGPLPLFAYLKLSAQRDMQNVLAKEARHWHGRKRLQSVEESPEGWKYLGREEDPSRPLELSEQAQKAEQEILRSMRQGLSLGEQQFLELMLQGERKTTAFADRLGIGHLSFREQQSEVKRVKDKLKKQIERGDHGRASE